MRIVSEGAEKIPPRFKDEHSQCLSVAVGSAIVLQAELADDLKDADLEITWSKDGAPLPPELPVRLKSKQVGNLLQLALDDVRKQDAGHYAVAAQSPAGTARRDMELMVTTSIAPDDADAPAFLRRLNDLSVKVGTRTRFLAEVRSRTDLTIEWFHNDVLVKEGERYRLVNEGGFHCIDLAPLIALDAGKWTCRATNDAGSVSSFAYLHVLVPKTYKPPEFLEELRALLTEKGTVSLECKVVGIPTPLLRWFKDGREIKAGDVFALTANPDDQTTLGTYTCEACNCMGKAYSSSKVHVVGSGSREGSLKPLDSVPSGPPPLFSRQLQDEYVKIGDTLILSCQVAVPPWPKSIIWYNSEGKIDDLLENSRYHQMADGLGGYMLEIKAAEAADAGEWKCVATSGGDANSVSTCVVKMAIPKHYRKPRFMECLKAILTEEGLVSFECKVVGSPTPTLRWFKDGHELKPGDVYQLSGTNSLGSYCCIATNCMGVTNSTAELTIEDIQNQLNDDEKQQLILKNQAPKFIQGLKTCEGRINDHFQLVVQVSIAPLPTLAWYRDDYPIDLEPEKYMIKTDSIGSCHLDISRLEFMDQAEWKCIASNEFGHTMTSCFLKLIVPKHFKKPRFLECLRAVLSEEGAVNLECKVIGVPQPVLKWYKDGEELKPGDIHKITSGANGTCCLGTYTCEAKNCMGVVSSSASLHGFEDGTKTRAEQQRLELARVPSLSTIHEERTSQMYDTPPQGDTSMTLNDHEEISFSFDGKEVSVSLYETPDITEEEAVQIIEMYADQLSDHVTPQNIVDLPPMRFIKETSNSGNLMMEAVLVDVSEDYFTSAEEDLRTEADVDEIFSISDDSRPFSPERNGSEPRRPPRKKNESPKSTYYSTAKNGSGRSENGEESMATAGDLESESNEFESAIGSNKLQDAFQVAAITETTSLPGDDLSNRQSVSPQNTHEIGSDLRVNRVGDEKAKRPRRRRSSRQSLSSDDSKEQEVKHRRKGVARDIHGEEGDGLVIDPVKQKAKIAEIKALEKTVCQKLRENIFDIQGELLKVEEDLLIQSSLKTTSAAANKSLEVLNSIVQPIKDIQMVLVTLEQNKDTDMNIAEIIAAPIFDLQKNITIVEKCVELQGRDHTLVQRTCYNIITTTSQKLQAGLKLIEDITLLEKEMIPVKAPGRQTPSKIIQEVLITIQELQGGLNKAHFITEAKRELQQKKKEVAEPVKEEKDIGILLKFAEPALEMQALISGVNDQISQKEDLDEKFRQEVIDKLESPVQKLCLEIQQIENKAIKFTGPKSLYKELHYALLDQVAAPIQELKRLLEEAKEPLDERREEIERLQFLNNPLEDVLDSLSKLSKNIPKGMEVEAETATPKQEVVKEVFDEVAQLVVNSVSRSVYDLLYNIENAQKVAKDSKLLEALRQLSTLQKDFASTVRNVEQTKSENAILALENLAQPIEMLNNQIVEVPGALPTDVLDDVIACLSILEDSITINESLAKEANMGFLDLKERAREVKDNILVLTDKCVPFEETVPSVVMEMVAVSIDPIAEEAEAVAKLVELKKCIAFLESMPHLRKAEMQDIPTPESITKMVDSINTIKATLATIQDPRPLESCEGLEVEVYDKAHIVTESLSKVKEVTEMLTTVAKPTVQDIEQIKAILKPLSELKATIQKVEIEQDPMVALEIPIMELQTAMETAEMNMKDVNEAIKNAMEIIAIERRNSEIQNENIAELSPIIDLLTNVKEDLIQNKNALPKLKALKQNIDVLSADSPVKYIAYAIADLTNSVKKAIETAPRPICEETTEHFEKLQKSLTKLEASPSFETKLGQIEILKSAVEEIKPLVDIDPEAKKSLENLVNFAQGVTARKIVFEEATVKANTVASELKRSASLSSSTEELNKIQHALVKVFEVPPEQAQILQPINQLIDEILWHPVEEPRKTLYGNIKDAVKPLKASVDKCKFKSLSKKDIALVQSVSEALHTINEFMDNKMSMQALKAGLAQFNDKLQSADIDTVNELLYPVQNLTVQAQSDLNDLIAIEGVLKAERAKTINYISERAQVLVQNIAAIKYPHLEKSAVVKLQKALNTLQMNANDLIDSSFTDKDRAVLNASARLLDSINKQVTITKIDASPEEVVTEVTTDMKALLAEVAEESAVQHLADALNSILVSVPVIIAQIGQGRRDAAKASLVESNFTRPLQQLESAQNQNEAINTYLTQMKTSAGHLIEMAQENNFNSEEAQYIQQIESFADNLETIVSTTEPNNYQDAVKKVEQVTEDVVNAGSNLRESPLRNIAPNIRRMCKIVIKVLEQIPQTAQVQAAVDEREVLYYIDDAPLPEEAPVQYTSQPEQEAVSIFQPLLSIVECVKNSLSTLQVSASVAPEQAGVMQNLDSKMASITENIQVERIQPDKLTIRDHHAISLSEKIMSEVNSSLPTQQVSASLVENVAELQHELETLDASSIKNIVQPIAQVGEMCVHAAHVQHAQSQPVIVSLKELQANVKKIEEQDLPVEKQAALKELENSIAALESNFLKENIQIANLSQEEQGALVFAEKALTTLTACITASDVASETSNELKGHLVEGAKATIDELRLAVLAVPAISSVKHIMEPLEETAKNVVNLIENIPSISGFTETVSPATSLQLAVDETVKYAKELEVAHISDARKQCLNETIQDMLSIQELATKFVISSPEDAELVKAEEKLVQQFKKYLEQPPSLDFVNVDESKSKPLFDTIAETRILTNNTPTSAPAHPMTMNANKFIVNILKLIEKPPPVVPERSLQKPLKDVQDNVQQLQEGIANLEMRVDSKIQRILTNEMPRPLTALQFICDNVVANKNEKLSGNDLHILTMTSDSIKLFRAVVNTIGEEVTVDLQELSDKLKVIIASINQESQVKDLHEPLHDISKTVDKVLEREKSLAKEEEDYQRSSINKLRSSLKNLDKVIARVVEQPDVEPKLLVLEELQKPLFAITSCPVEEVNQIDVQCINKLIESVESISNTISSTLEYEIIDKPMQILYDTISEISMRPEYSSELPSTEPTFVQAIRTELKDLKKAIELTHCVFEKPKSIEDIREIQIIHAPLKNLLKFVLTIKHQPEGDLDLFSEIQEYLHILQNKLMDCGDARLVNAEIPFLETIGNAFNDISAIAADRDLKQLNLGMFAKPLEALQTNIITICTKVVFTDQLEESIIQKIVEPLEKITIGIISINSLHQDRKLVRRTTTDLVNNIKEINNLLNSDPIGMLSTPLTNLANHVQEHKGLFNIEEIDLDDIIKTLNDVVKVADIDKSVKSHVHSLELNVTTMMEKSHNLDELEQVILLSEPIDQIRKALKQSLKCVPTESPVNELAAVVNQLKDNIDTIKAVDTTDTMQTAIISLEEPLLQIRQALDIITIQEVEEIKELDQPLNQLADVTAKLVDKEISVLSVVPELNAIKEQIEHKVASLTTSANVEVIKEPLQALVAAIDKSTRVYEKQILENVKKPLHLIQVSIENLVQQEKPSQGILSIIEITTPIAELQENLEELQTLDQSNLETLKMIQEPLSELAQAIEEAVTVQEASKFIEKIKILKDKLEVSAQDVKIAEPLTAVKGKLGEIEAILVADADVAPTLEPNEKVEEVKQIPGEVEEKTPEKQEMEEKVEKLVSESIDEEKNYKKAVKNIKFPFYEIHSQIVEMKKRVPDVKKASEGVAQIVELLPKLEAFCNNIDTVKLPLLVIADFKKMQGPCLEVASALGALVNILNNEEAFAKQKPELRSKMIDFKQELSKLFQNDEMKNMPMLLEKLTEIGNQTDTIVAALEEKKKEVADEVVSDVAQTKYDQLRQPLVLLQQQVSELKAREEDIKQTAAAGIMSAAQLEEPIRAMLEHVATMEAEHITAQELDTLPDSINKFATAISDVVENLGRPAEVSVKKQELCEAIAELQISAETVHSVLPLQALTTKISEIKVALEAQVESSHADVAQAFDIKQSIKDLQQAIQSVSNMSAAQLETSQSEMLNIVQLDKPLVELLDGIASLEEVQQECVKDFYVLATPLQNLTATLVEVEGDMNDPAMAEHQKVKLQKALMLLKDGLDVPQIQQIRITEMPLLSLSAELSSLNDRLGEKRPDVEKIKATVVDLQNEVNIMQVQVSDNHLKPSQGMSAVMGIGEQLQELIANISDIEGNHEAVSIVNELVQPLSLVSSAIKGFTENLLSSEDVTTEEKKVFEAIMPLKELIVKSHVDIGKVQGTEVVNIQLQKLAATIANIEDGIHKDKIEKVKLPLQQLVSSIETIASKPEITNLEADIIRAAGKLIVPLEELQANISTEIVQLESMGALESPIKELTTALSAVQELPITDSAESDRTIVHDAITKLKSSIEIVKVEQCKNVLISEPLQALSEALLSFDSALTKEKLTLGEIKLPLESIRQRIETLKTNPQHAKMAIISLEAPLQEVLMHVQIAEDNQEMEKCTALKELHQPLTNLANILQQAADILENPENIKIVKPNLCEALENIKCQIVTQEMTKPVAQLLTEVEHDLHKVEICDNLKGTKENLVILTRELDLTQAKINESCLKPQNAVVEICKLSAVLEDLSKNIEQLEAMPGSQENCDLTEELKIMDSPIKELAKEAKKLSTSPDTGLADTANLITAISTVVEVIDNLANKPSIAPVPLHPLSRQLSVIKQQLQEDTARATAKMKFQKVKIVLQELNANLNQVKEQQTVVQIETQRGILSLCDIIEPLNCVQRLIDSQMETEDSTVFNELQDLSKIEDPIKQLTENILDITSLLAQPNELQSNKENILSAIENVKTTFEKIPIISKELKPITTLTATIQDVQNAIRAMEYKRMPIKDVIAIKDVISCVQTLMNNIGTIQAKSRKDNVFECLSTLSTPTEYLNKDLINIGELLIDDNDVKSVKDDYNKLTLLKKNINTCCDQLSDVSKQPAEIVQKNKQLKKSLKDLMSCLHTITPTGHFLSLSSNLTEYSKQIELVLQNIDKLNEKDAIQNLVFSFSNVIEPLDKNIILIRDKGNQAVKTLFGNFKQPLQQIEQSIMNFSVQDTRATIIAKTNAFVPFCKQIIDITSATKARIEDNEDGKLLKKTLTYVQDNCEQFSSEITDCNANNNVLENCDHLADAMNKLYESLIATKYSDSSEEKIEDVTKLQDMTDQEKPEEEKSKQEAKETSNNQEDEMKAKNDAKEEAAQEAKVKAEEKAKKNSEMEAKKRAEQDAEEQAAAKEKSEKQAEHKTELAAKAEEEAKEKAIKEAKEKAEIEAKYNAERDAKEKVELEAKLKAEKEAKDKVEKEAREKAERDAKEVAEKEAKEKTERETKLKIEQEAKQKAEIDAKERAEKQANEKAEQEAKDRAEFEAQELKEKEANKQAGREAKLKAETGAREKAEKEANENAEHEAKLKAEQDTKKQAEQAAKEDAERVQTEAKEKAAKSKEDKDAKEKFEQEAQIKVEKEAKEKHEQEVKENAEKEAHIKEVEAAKIQVEKEAKEKSEREAKEKDEREAKEKAEKEATEVKERAERDSKEKAEKAAKAKAEEESKKKAEIEAKENAELKAKEDAANKAQKESKEKADRKANEKAEQDAKEKAEKEATEAEEKQKKVKIDEEIKKKAETEAKEKAERESKEKAEKESKAKAEKEAKEKAELEAKIKAEEEAKKRAAEEAKQAKEKAEKEAKQKADNELKEKAELDAKLTSEKEAKEKSDKAAKEKAAALKAAQEAQETAEKEAKEKIEREAKEKAEKAAKEKTELEAKMKAEQEAKKKEAEEAKEAKEKADEEAKQKADNEAKEKAQLDAKLTSEKEAKEKSDKAAKEKAEEETTLKAAQEAQEKEAKEAKEKVEREAKEKAEKAAKEKTDLEVKIKAEQEAKKNADRKAKEKEEADIAAKEKTEQDAKEKAEKEATEAEEKEKKVKADDEIKKKAEIEAKEKAERESKEKAEKESKAKAEKEAKEKAELEAKIKAEEEANKRAAEEAKEAKEKAEKEVKQKADNEAKEKAELDAKLKSEKEAKEKSDKAAKEKAEEETTLKAAQEAQEKVEKEAQEKIEREAKETAEKAAKEKTELEAKIKAEQEAKKMAAKKAKEKEKADKAAKEKTEQDAKEKAEKEAKLKKEKEEKDANEKAERESTLKAEKEALDKAEREAKIEAEEAKLKTEREAKEKAEKECKEKVEQEAKYKAETEAKLKKEKDEEEMEAKEKSDQAAKIKAEKESKEKAEKIEKEAKDREKADKAAKQKAQKEAKENAEKELKITAENEKKLKTEKEEAEKVAKEKAELEAKAKLEEEAKEHGRQQAKKNEKKNKDKAERKSTLKAEEDIQASAEDIEHPNMVSNDRANKYFKEEAKAEIKPQAQLESRVRSRDPMPQVNLNNEDISARERRGRSPVRERARFTGREQFTNGMEMYKPSRYQGSRFMDRKPTFTTSLTNRTATAGTRVKLMCSVLATDEANIEWLKNGQPIEKDSNYITSYQDGIATLEFLNTTTSDTAEYACIARNGHGFNSTKADLKVYEGFDAAPIPPTFTRPIREQYKCGDNQLILECRLRAHPTPNIIWFKDGKEITANDRCTLYYLADGICRLTIHNPDPSDSGCYSCRAENRSWSDQISHYINFGGKNEFISSRSDRSYSAKSYTDVRRPHLSNVLTDAHIPTGGVLALQVEVKGVATDIKWYKDADIMPKLSPRHKSFYEGGVYTLLFPKTLETDVGKYTFKATNAYGNIETSAYVNIVNPSQVGDGKPAMFLSRPDSDLSVTNGEDITVSFRLAGEPKPKVTLMKGLKDITNSHRCMKFTSDDYTRFSLKRATENDTGTYCILAKNRFGCDRAFFTVKLRQRARSASPFKSRSGAEILDEIPSYQERQYLKDVPGAISSLPIVIDTGKNWISLSWGKPDYRGAAPVLAYKVDAWQKGGETRWVELGMTPINSFDAFNLIPDAEYQFRITARNRYGWGEPSQSDPIVVGRHVELPEFTQILPGHSKALRGSAIEFQCHIRDSTNAQIRWYKDGFELNPSENPRLSINNSNGICILKIVNVRPGDEGRYSCEAINKIGRIANFVRLSVVSDSKLLVADENLKRALEDKNIDVPPQFTMHLRDRRIQASYPVRLTCQVSGQPSPSIIWTKNGVVLSMDNNKATWSENSFHTLEFFKTLQSDSGVYGAIAKNSFGSVSCRCKLVVDEGIKAYLAPQFKGTCNPDKVQLNEGDQLHITALVEAYPTVNVVWYRNGMRLRPSRKTVTTLSHDGRIVLSVGSITASDSGVYTCVATNEVGRADTYSTVEVSGSLKNLEESEESEEAIQREQRELPYSKEPAFITKPMNTVAYEGDNVIILCEVIGDPKPDVLWLRDFLKPEYYKDAAHFRRVGDGPEYRLEIQHAKFDFTGTYTVYAKNCHGDAKAIISLQIKAKDMLANTATSRRLGNVQTLPRIVVPLKDIRCCDTDSVSFECKVDATPAPNVRWEKNGKIIHLDEDFKSDFDGVVAKLYIREIYPEDEGEYTCVAYNDLGKAATSACLIVDVPEARETILSESHMMSLLVPTIQKSPSAETISHGGYRRTPARSVSPSPRGRQREVTPRRAPKVPRNRCIPPKFFAIPRNKVVEEGTTVRLTASVSGHPDPWIVWDKDRKVLNHGGRICIKEEEDLRILEIRDCVQKDSGLYRVVLENDVGRIEASARVDVIAHYYPHSDGTGVRARSESPLHPKFRRFALGITPIPRIYHYNEHKYSRALSAPYYPRITSNSLSVPHKAPYNEDVKAPVFVEELPPVAHTSLGAEISMRVRAIAGPNYDVIWMKDGCVLPNCRDFVQKDDAHGNISLLIPHSTFNDAGTYRCEIYNIFGDAISKSRVVVRGELN